MESALANWEGVPELEANGRSICHFIESVELRSAIEPGQYAANELPNTLAVFDFDDAAFQTVD